MATIIKHSDLVSRAVSFIREKLGENPGKDMHALVDEAAMRFNLSPQDAESLLRILVEEKKVSTKQ